MNIIKDATRIDADPALVGTQQSPPHAKKRILVISPTPTHPACAGNRARIFALAQALRDAGHDVHFAFIRMEAADEEAMQCWWGENYHPIPYTRPPIHYSFPSRVKKKITERFDPTRRFAFRIDDWFDDSALDVLHRLHRLHGFDVAITEYVFISKALTVFGSKVLKIIDTHDVFTDRHKIYLANGSHPQWFSTTRAEEAKALKRANAVIAIQEHERAFFAGLSPVIVITVGHLARIEALQTKSSSLTSRSLLFVGSSNPINVEALDFFMANTFPLIKATLPEACVLAAGTVCEKLEKRPDLVKLGPLGDIADAYRQAAVVINPVRFGTGLNVKTIEALGFGMPVVATSVGSKGLNVEPPPLIIADTPEDFAVAAIKLLTDRALADNFARAALDFAHDWNQRHLEALRNLIGSGELTHDVAVDAACHEHSPR